MYYVKEELVSISDWNRNHIPCQTDEWYFLVSWENMISEMEFGMTQYLSMPSHTVGGVTAFTHLLKQWKIMKLKTKSVDTEYEWEDGSNLNF